MLYYCKKCGRIIFKMDFDDKICDCCKSTVFPIPDEYKGDYATYQNNLREKYVKPSPEFDQYLFDHRDEILAKQNAEFNKKMAIGKAISEGADPKMAFKTGGNVPKCTYCGSANIKKISTTGRIMSTGFFGLGSKTIGKQFHCNNCGADF